MGLFEWCLSFATRIATFGDRHCELHGVASVSVALDNKWKSRCCMSTNVDEYTLTQE